MLDALTQAKIKAIVKSYKRTHPEDYAMVCKAIEGKRKLLHDEFATVQGSNTEMRGLYEIPEDLYTDLVIKLDEAELLELKTTAGGRWFATTFREFSLPKSI